MFDLPLLALDVAKRRGASPSSSRSVGSVDGVGTVNRFANTRAQFPGWIRTIISWLEKFVYKGQGGLKSMGHPRWDVSRFYASPLGCIKVLCIPAGMYQGFVHPRRDVSRICASLVGKFFQSRYNVIITTLPQERGLIHPLSLPLGHIPRGRLAGMSQPPYPTGGVVIISQYPSI